jgi:hypothetical protein
MKNKDAQTENHDKKPFQMAVLMNLPNRKKVHTSTTFL